MGRNYDKELADAMAKVKRIQAAKEKAEQKRYGSVGKAICEAFGENIADVKSQKELQAFARELHRLYEAAHVGATVDAQVMEPQSEPVVASPQSHDVADDVAR